MTAHVAIAADGAYVEHGLVTMRSVLANAGDAEVVVHFLHGDDLSGEWARGLAEAAHDGGGELDLQHIDDEALSGVPLYRGRTLANWYRYLLPDLLPGVETVLYLDSDTVVADDLRPLWATPLDDCYVAAVDDLWGAWLNPREPRRLAVSSGRRYFNAGVLLMNLDTMREDGVVPELLAYGRFMTGEALLPNQDALNAVLGGRRKELDPRWNVMNVAVLLHRDAIRRFGLEAFEKAARRPAIRHFEGRLKPWHEELPLPHRELYLAHR